MSGPRLTALVLSVIVKNSPKPGPESAYRTDRRKAQRNSPRGAKPTARIVDRVAALLKRYVFLPDEHLYLLIALWILATHLIDVWDYVGYLFFYSSEPQSGKSRALEVLDLLVANSSSIFISPSEAVLFRTAEGETQLLDEVDSWNNGDQVRSVLNAGFRKGGTVPRMDQTDKGYVVKRFPVFGPKALAGIGLKILDATTRDRTFAIAMKRQAKSERRESLRLRKVGGEFAALKKEIEAWVTSNRTHIQARYERDLDYLTDFKDRTIDVTQPLGAVLEVAYAGSAHIKRHRIALVHAIAITRKEEETVIKDHRILETLLKLTEQEDPLVGTATELSTLCGDLADMTGDDISATLRRYGFRNKSKRKNGSPRYRYVLSSQQLADLTSRYAGNSV